MTNQDALQRGEDVSRYIPIAQYAMIGNCRTAALVSSEGSIDFYCPRRFDAPAVFCRMLDADSGGYFTVVPDGDFRIIRRYVGATNLLQTSFRGPRSTVTITDFMPVGKEKVEDSTVDVSAEARIIRIVETVGEVDVEIRFKPTFDFARTKANVTPTDGGVIARCDSDWLALACEGASFEQCDDGSWKAKVHLSNGARRFVILSSAGSEDEARQALHYDKGDDDFRRTRQFWNEWGERCTYRGPYRADVLRSALTLKLLCYEPSGAIVAAPTTSLPEWIGGVRNWDYRYTWLRDSSLILYALCTVGYQAEAAQFLHWLRETVSKHRPERPAIMYALDGTEVPHEECLDNLSGYRDSRPVRTGNQAAHQKQLDVYGEVLISAYIHYHFLRDHDSTHGPDADAWSTLQSLVDDAVDVWQQKDNGIWEVRGGERDFLYSKLLCWAAVDRGIKIAEEWNLDADLDTWKDTRKKIRSAIEEQGYNEKVGAFVQSFGSSTIDASALVIPRIGFLPATDKRVLSTIKVIQEQLVEGGFVYRYRGEDGLPGKEGAFLLCTFWLIDALALAGQLDEARSMFEHVVALRDDVGLLSEEIDPSTGVFLGNFPQGFSHLSLIQSAANLAKVHVHGPEEEAETEAQRSTPAKHAASQSHG